MPLHSGQVSVGLREVNQRDGILRNRSAMGELQIMRYQADNLLKLRPDYQREQNPRYRSHNGLDR